MNIEEAKKLVRDIARARWVRITNHCQERMQKRNVMMDDVLQVFLWGEITELRENTVQKNWECQIKGHDVEGDPLIVKLAILEHEFALLCITVHGE